MRITVNQREIPTIFHPPLIRIIQKLRKNEQEYGHEQNK